MPVTHDTDCRMSSPRYLSLWLGLQHIGHDGVAARIQHAVSLVTIVTNHTLMVVCMYVDNNFLTQISAAADEPAA